MSAANHKILFLLRWHIANEEADDSGDLPEDVKAFFIAYECVIVDVRKQVAARGIELDS